MSLVASLLRKQKNRVATVSPLRDRLFSLDSNSDGFPHMLAILIGRQNIKVSFLRYYRNEIEGARMAVILRYQTELPEPNAEIIRDAAHNRKHAYGSSDVKPGV